MTHRINKTKRIIFIILVATFFTTSVAGAVFLYFKKNLPNVANFDGRKIAQTSKIYDKTGEVLLYEIHGEEKRSLIEFSDIPEQIKKATIAIEDYNFYNHGPIDWKSIIRAGIINLTSGEVVQGGSTITQQLAKKAFLTDDRVFIRKFKELILSIELEKKYSKDEILSLYLNQIPYGSNAYGIEAASETYFEKSVKDLSLAEIAVLVSLPQAPSYYSPWGSHKDKLIARSHLVLEKMLEFNYINQKEYEEAINKNIIFTKQTASIKAPHFVMMVIDYLNTQYGEDFVRTGGLKITTTLDWNLQELAERVVLDGANRNESLYEGKNSALIAEDSNTGQILAYVGSRNYFDKDIDGNFDVARLGLRQPGSTIKPFAYLTAFKKGYTPNTILFDLETEFNSTDEEDKSYKPQNFDEEFVGPITMREALAQSKNVPAVKTLYLAGLDNVLKTTKDFGISTLTERSRYGLSLVLGGGEVKLIDLVSAYSVLSQDGIKRNQSFILKIEKANEIIESYSNSEKQIIDPQYIREINNILSDINLRKPLFQNSLELTTSPNQEIALKTGTTNDYRDAWAVGYTPSLVVGVWAGNNDNKPMVKKGSSILAAVPIWSAFLKEVIKDKSQELFPKPEERIVEKPILRGEYIINNQIHEILYYVNKNDPQGNIPDHPENDSQFKNWEDAVIKWLEVNTIDKLIEKNPNALSGGAISITLNSPINGDFLKQNNNVNAKIISSDDIIKVEVYLNNKLIPQNSTSLIKSGSEYYFYSDFTNNSTELQNTFKIKAENTKGSIIEKEIILFK